MSRYREHGDGKLMVILTVLGVAVAVAAMWLAHVDARSDKPSGADPALTQAQDPKREPEPPKPPTVSAEIRFEQANFPPSQSRPGAPNQNGSWDCYCGEDMEVNPSTVSGSPGDELTFTWDATRICKGLGMENTGGALSVSKGGTEITSRTLPKGWGTAHVKINLPGLYDVTIKYHTTCLNNTKRRDCNTSGQAQLHVTSP
jgi:hypothetical protein